MVALTSSTAHGVHANGVTAGSQRPLNPGVWAPIPSFFLPESEDLDIPTFEKHIVHVAQSGVRPLICGSMGEAPHLLHDERVTLIRAARRALDSVNLQHVPLVVGTGATSLRETIILTKEAAAAGADYSIIICSGYFAGALANDKNALTHFWLEAAAKSPIPVIIYNYPGACGGIDLDSDTIISIAQQSPNIVGVKLTCGNVGKLTRIASVTTTPEFMKTYPRIRPEQPFLVLGGYTDFIIPSAFANGHGAITGLANIGPYTCIKLFEMGETLKSNLVYPSSSKNTGLLAEAIRLQGIVAQADRTMAVAGINGTKSVLEKMWGYGGAPRRPLPPYPKELIPKLWSDPNVQAFIEEETIAMNASGSTQQIASKYPPQTNGVAH